MKEKDINKVKETMLTQQIEPEKINKVVEVLSSEPDNGRTNQTVKKQYVIVISDPENKLPDQDFVGWVCQVGEDESPVVAVEKIVQGSYDFNASPKGRRMPVQTIGEACEAVPARYLKAHNVWVKTKEPVLIIKTDNKIPRE